MHSTALFSMALGMPSPRRHGYFFSDGTPKNGICPLILQRFPDATDIARSVHDTVKRTWQHLNFFDPSIFKK